MHSASESHLVSAQILDRFHGIFNVSSQSSSPTNVGGSGAKGGGVEQRVAHMKQRASFIHSGFNPLVEVEVEVEVDSTQPLGYGKVWKRLGLRSSSENYYHGDLPSPL